MTMCASGMPSERPLRATVFPAGPDAHRRRRRSTAAVLLWAVAALLASGMPSTPAFAATEPGKAILRVYAWSDFFDSDVLASFEERYNCVVAIDTFDSNEAMLEDIEDRVGPAYDLITPSGYMAAEMRRRRLIRDLDHSLLPNLANIDPAFSSKTADPGMRHSVPYTRTVTGVGYNRRLLGVVRPSWAIFDRRDLAGRLTMLDDMRESMGAALKRLGYSLNTVNDAELARAGELLREWRGNLAKFEVDEGNIGLGAGEYAAVHGYNGDLALLMEENPDIGFFVPEEGSAISTDDFVVMAESPNHELAHRFINHFLDVDNAARNMEGILYYMPIPDAIARLGEELRDNEAFAVPDRILANCEVIRDLGEANAKYEAIWETVRGGMDGGR